MAWTQYTDDNGYPFWYNDETGVSQHEAPGAAPSQVQVGQDSGGVGGFMANQSDLVGNAQRRISADGKGIEALNPATGQWESVINGGASGLPVDFFASTAGKYGGGSAALPGGQPETFMDTGLPNLIMAGMLGLPALTAGAGVGAAAASNPGGLSSLIDAATPAMTAPGLGALAPSTGALSSLAGASNPGGLSSLIDAATPAMTAPGVTSAVAPGALSTLANTASNPLPPDWATPDAMPTPPGNNVIPPDWSTPDARLPSNLTPPAIPPGVKDVVKAVAPSAISKIASGNGTTADWLQLAGQLAPGIAGAIGSSQQAGAMSDLANKYWGAGAPSRGRYEASMTPGFDPTSIPGYSGAVNASSDALLRKLSAAGGNPYGNPGGMIEANKQVINGTALPAIQNYQNQNATTGGFQTLAGNFNGAATQAIGSQAGALSSLGAAGANVLNPQSTSPFGSGSMADWIKAMTASNSGVNTANNGFQ